MNNNIIIIQTLIPIFFALLIIIFSNNYVGKIFGLFSCILSFFSSCYLSFCFSNKSQNTSIDYFLGGIDPIFGIALKANFINSNICLLINFCSLAIFVYLLGAKKDSVKFSESSLILIFLAGMNGILFANDIFNIFVFLELSSIASYALVINSRNVKSTHIAFSYLIFGSISASFYLIGVAFLYNQFGFLNLDLISKIFYEESFTKLPINLIYASFFIFSGLFMKLGSFPVYNYLVEVYQKSSSHISALFSGISSKINLYLIFFLFFSVFHFSQFEKEFHFEKIIGYFGLFGGLFFAILANFVHKKNIKKILVFSSFSQINYFLSFFIFGKSIFENKEISKILMWLIFNHSLSKIGLFLFFESFFSQKFIEIECKKNLLSENFKKFHFKEWQKKILDLCFVIFICHSFAFPPLIGFFGKFSLILKMFESEKYIALMIFFLIIFFSVLYNLKIFFEYFQSKNQIYREEQDDKKLSISSFKMVSFYNLFFALMILISGLFFSLFIF